MVVSATGQSHKTDQVYSLTSSDVFLALYHPSSPQKQDNPKVLPNDPSNMPIVENNMQQQASCSDDKMKEKVKYSDLMKSSGLSSTQGSKGVKVDPITIKRISYN